MASRLFAGVCLRALVVLASQSTGEFAREERTALQSAKTTCIQMGEGKLSARSVSLHFRASHPPWVVASIPVSHPSTAAPVPSPV